MKKLRLELCQSLTTVHKALKQALNIVTFSVRYYILLHYISVNKYIEKN